MEQAIANALEVGDIVTTSKKCLKYGENWAGQFVVDSLYRDAIDDVFSVVGKRTDGVPGFNTGSFNLGLLTDDVIKKNAVKPVEQWVKFDIYSMPPVGSKVKLVDRAGLSAGGLTVGNLYEVVVHKTDIIGIIDDEGRQRNLMPSRFLKNVGGSKKETVYVRATSIDQLEEGEKYNLCSWEEMKDEEGTGYYVGRVGSMSCYAGTEVTIKTKSRYGKYVGIVEDGDSYSWNPTWFLIPTEQEAAAKPKIKEGDVVVVFKKTDNKKCKWLEEMDECLNEKGKVLSINKDEFYEVETISGTFFYPADAICTLKDFRAIKGKLKINNAIIEQSMKEKAEEWLDKNNQGKAVSRFARFVVKGDEVAVDSHACAPCHAGLSYNIASPIVGVLDVPYMGGKDPRVPNVETYKRFADYIINRSPFSIAYIKGQEVDEILKNGVWLDVNQTADVIASACITLRHGTEHNSHVQSFDWFVKQGFDEAVAFLASFLVRVDGDKVTKGRADGGHMALASYMTTKKIIKFFKGGGFLGQKNRKPYKENDVVYKVIPAITGDDSWYGKGRGDELGDFLTANFKPTETGKGFDKVSSYTHESAINFANALKKEFENA